MLNSIGEIQCNTYSKTSRRFISFELLHHQDGNTQKNTLIKKKFFLIFVYYVMSYYDNDGDGKQNNTNNTEEQIYNNPDFFFRVRGLYSSKLVAEEFYRTEYLEHIDARSATL